jgi:hypothetical protein
LTLGPAASFGAFTPGVGKDYLATTTTSVVSTAGDATLTVADLATTDTGSSSAARSRRPRRYRRTR